MYLSIHKYRFQEKFFFNIRNYISCNYPVTGTCIIRDFAYVAELPPADPEIQFTEYVEAHKRQQSEHTGLNFSFMLMDHCAYANTIQ